MKKLLIFLFVFVLLGCTGENREYLKIGTNVWIGYEPLYLARELGYLDGYPVHLVEYSSSSQVIRAYRNRIINGAALTLDETLLLKDYGFDPVVVLVMDISEGADAIVAREGIKSLKDLRGKKVGVENSALGAYVLSRALEKGGLSPDEITIIPLEVDEHYHWFKTGKIDAVVTFEPVKSKLLKLGGKVIFDSSQIPGEIVDVLVIERSYIEKHPEVVGRVVNSWFKALNYMKSFKKQSFMVISQREHIPVGDLLKAYRGIQIPDRHVNLLLLNHSQPRLKAVAKKLLKIMREKKIISRENISIDDLFDSRFIKGY
ncbi:ABC transporter substrate-binding protein [Persephonella sp.]